MTTPAGADNWDDAPTYVLGETSAPTLLSDLDPGGSYGAYWSFHPDSSYDVSFSIVTSDCADPTDIQVQLLAGGSDYGSATFIAFDNTEIDASVNTAAVYHLVVYLPSGDPVGDDVTNYIVTSTATLTGPPPHEGGTDNTPDLGQALETSVAYPISLSRTGQVTGTNSPSIDLGGETLLVVPDFQLTVLDTVVRRAPTSITITVNGGPAGEDITFWMDTGTDGSGTPDDVYTTSLDSDGGLGPTSLTIDGELGGQQGSRTILATIGTGDGQLSATATYFVQIIPIVAETNQGADAQAVVVPGALNEVTGVRHWVFQDLLGVEDGGIGSYILTTNPSSMTSPHLEFALTSRHTTAHSGQFHVWQAGDIPKEWTFSGFTADQDMVEQLEVYRGLNRRFYLIDHHNRAWKVVFENVEIVPRLRLNYNGEVTDWGTDYTVTATIVDQNWVTPA